MTDRFVQIATFNYPHEMYILKTKLESEGIECNEYDGNTVSANPLLSNAIGGVKLMVKEEDAERAIKIMNDFYEETESSFDADETIKDDENTQEVLTKKESKGCMLFFMTLTVIISIIIGITFF